MDTINKYNINTASKSQCLEWLANHGLAISWTHNEMKQRINKFLLYPSLVEKLHKKATKSFNFVTSLHPNNIPLLSNEWSVNTKLYPIISEKDFSSYASKKFEGSLGQQKKAHQMLHSRKIVSVKSFNDSGNLFVRALIKKSYGHEARPAIVLFINNKPVRGYCECPVGVSGLCCHVLCLLLYLIHYENTNEKILELTCTEVLQKWHKRSKKGSVPILPL